MNAQLTSLGYNVKTTDDLRKYVPAAFSTSFHPDRTNLYSMFSTENFLDTVAKLGWNPYSAKQQGAGPFGRHIIRLENSKMSNININGDSIKPQLMIDNSHNGLTKGQIHLGLFRLVCSNGLVIGIPGLNTSLKFRHLGLDPLEVMKLVEETADQYQYVGEHLNDMQQVIMSEEQKLEFAMNAVALRESTRFFKADKSVDFNAITKAMDPRSLFKPNRTEDVADDLWTVFNVVQERTVNGLYERKASSGKKGSPRVITNATRNLEYNKKLWSLAETFMP